MSWQIPGDTPQHSIPREQQIRATAVVMDHIPDDWERREILAMLMKPCDERPMRAHCSACGQRFYGWKLSHGRDAKRCPACHAANRYAPRGG